MKGESLISGKNKTNYIYIINLTSAELAQRVVRVKVLITTAADVILILFCILRRK